MRTVNTRCGVLLAGGASTRFGGSPKGLAPLGGQRVADFPLAALTRVCETVVIASNDSDASRWFPAHRVVADREAGRGALGALETALRIADGRPAVVCAWDMPCVTSDLLDALAVEVEAGAACAVPQHSDGRFEPLCAVYGARCLPIVEALLARGVRAAHAVVAESQGHGWPIAPAPDGFSPFFNINTRDDLALAESHWSHHVADP